MSAICRLILGIVLMAGGALSAISLLENMAFADTLGDICNDDSASTCEMRKDPTQRTCVGLPDPCILLKTGYTCACANVPTSTTDCYCEATST